MIKSLEIKNFKSIKSKVFPLRNLNLLLGLNGMGKSTFIQSLLLLRQSDRLRQKELKLNSHFVNIGTTKDALYQYSKKGEDLSFNIQFEGLGKYELDFNYVIEADNFTLKKDGVLDDSFFKQTLFSNNFQYLGSIRLGPNSIHYKNYTSVVTLNNVGSGGEFAAHFIEVHGNDEITFKNLLHEKSITKDELTGEQLVNKTLINQINLWMGEISPGVNIKTTAIPNSENILLEYVFIQPNFGNTNRFKPANVGFGISYVLPVVTALLASRPGELLIIENPESHIHPRGQAELGKLIALAAMNDVQIIIETHSDHVLNGIRVATKKHNELSQKIAAFYFEKTIERSEQYSTITNIEIDTQGELSEYPATLLSEWSNQLMKLASNGDDL